MDELDLGATIRGFSVGQKVFGRYTLKKILGRGGMGVVWLARDEKLDEEVALKFLPDVVKHDPAALDELKAETKRARRLTHAGIVRIHDFLEDNHTAAIAMEAVDGVTLSQFRVEQPGKIFEVAAIAAWVKQLCSTLDYAHHTARVVHRDLKPANLMVDRTGQIKVTDFGIARSISDSVSRASAQAGSSGTPAYMSPQQMLGEKPAVTDDVYALGATVYELLTGKPPFYSGNVMLQVQSKVPPAIADRRMELEISGAPIPSEWEAVVAACLVKTPGDRPQTVAEVAKRLGLDDGSFVGRDIRPNTPALPMNLDAGDTRQFVQTDPRSRQTAGEIPAGTVRQAPAGSKRLRYVAIIAAVLLAGAGYYFGRYVPEQKRIAAEQDNKTAEERRQAEQEGRAVAEQKRRTIEAEDKAYQEISRLVLGLGEAAPRADYDSVQRAVETYLATAPERYRAPVTADWERKGKTWLAYELAHRPGTLVVETNPPGATVILYPANIRKTSPATFKDVKPGEVSYRVEQEGFEPQDLSFIIKPGVENKADLVRLISLTGSAVITSNPAGAKVSLDGNSRHFDGVTPFRQEAIPPGTYRVTLQRENWRPVEKTLVVMRNELVNLTAELRGVNLDIRSDPAGAQVELNGKPVGVTPLKLTDQAPGEYRLVMNLAGFDSATKTVTADRNTEVNLALQRTVAKVGRLVIIHKLHILGAISNPDVKIDGVVKGQIANGSYWATELPVGEYDIALKSFGVSETNAHVRIEKGRTVYLELSFSMSYTLGSKAEVVGRQAVASMKPAKSSPLRIDGTEESKDTP